MSNLITLTDDQIVNVKHVLFGLQKQANVINEAVVKIIASGLVRHNDISALDSQESIVASAQQFLEKVVADNGCSSEDDRTFIMLLAGEQSLANLDAQGPKSVYVEQPNPESPKYLFRIYMLGESPAITRTAEAGNSELNVNQVVTTPAFTDDCPYDPMDSYAVRAEKIKKAILPLVPDIVKTEIPDNDYAQALCMAEYYYRHKD